MELELAYLAGILDGEAYMGHHNPKRGRPRFQMSVEMTVEEIPTLLQTTLGGRVYTRHRNKEPGRENEKRTWTWTVQGVEGEAVYKRMEPYLRLKVGKLT